MYAYIKFNVRGMYYFKEFTNRLQRKMVMQFYDIDTLEEKKSLTKKEFFFCDKNCWVSRTNIKKQTIKISELFNGLFPNVAVTTRESEKSIGPLLAWKHKLSCSMA